MILERLQIAYLNAGAKESADLTLDQIITSNKDLIDDGFVYKQPAGQKSYEITNIKVNDSNIGENVTVPNNGSVTLKVTITELSGASSKYYGIIEGKYYEIKLIDEQIVLDDEAKTLQEIQNGVNIETPTLIAEWDNQTGDNANINNLSLSVNGENVIVTDSGAEVGTRTIKISYGANATRIVKIISTQTYTLSYNSNGGTGTMSSQIGSDLVVADNGFTAPEGKVFKEWRTSKGESYDKYDPEDEISLGSNVTLYAIWEDNVFDGDDLTGTIWKFDTGDRRITENRDSFSYEIDFEMGGIYSSLNADFSHDSQHAGSDLWTLYFDDEKVCEVWIFDDNTAQNWLKNGYLIIQGGNDVKNSNLIAWLKEYAIFIR